MSPLRVLQLTSDWKWTGPAEPMLRLAEGQRARGHQVWLACPSAPESADRSVGSEARKLGWIPSLELPRGRGVRPLSDLPTIRALRGLIDEHGIELVHTWHTRDHVLALRAAGRRSISGRPAVVRSYRIAEQIADRPWNRWLYGARTDGLLCVSPETARSNRALRRGRAIRGVFGAVDVDRFRPVAPDADLRRALGLAPEHHVVGIVARVQPHRRFDLLLEAARLQADRDPAFRLLVIGRGTRRSELAEEPARRMGLEDRVVFAGYRREDYADVLRSMDVFTFLVPGSDGTCRALLEAAAAGIPAVTLRRGALPEIVVDRKTGLLVPDDPVALADGWQALLDDDEKRRAFGAEARKRAEACFTPERLADEVEVLYREALA
ncbi:MAG: glycosyltransferase family 4 protein [bacterium]|nr:glycosyltransferase family 4 protein [bacterium]